MQCYKWKQHTNNNSDNNGCRMNRYIWLIRCLGHTIDVVHNRTVNLHGGLGHNIAMDTIYEFLNAEFKGSINND